MQLKDVLRHQPDIRTYAGGSVFTSKTLVGIEVELEKFNSNMPRLTYWNCEGDGSLREGGIEFVLKQPLTGYDLELSIEELQEKVLTCNYEANHRCSTHVHIDARDMSVGHLGAMVFVYCMVERLIYDRVSPDRADNFYCIPMYSSAQHRRIVSAAIDKLSFDACPKYSGINLRTLNQYGSLEFRMHNGITADNSLVQWVQMLTALKEGTKQFEDVEPATLLRRFSDDRAESIIRAVFGELADDLIGVTDYHERLKESMRSAQDMLILRKSGSLRNKERDWVRSYRGKNVGGSVAGIPDEILEKLRARRDELFA